MRVTRIIVDGREYPLRTEQNVEAIMGRITEQVRAGGGFVELVLTSHRALNLLVSPGMSLSVESLHVEDDNGAAETDSESSRRSWFDPFNLT